jgi:SMODS and SLOG-associating 2TM effector domain 3
MDIPRQISHAGQARPGQPTTGEAEPATVGGMTEPAKASWFRFQRPALLARFPKIFWNPSLDDPWANDWPMVRSEHLAEFPALADDLAMWTEELEPRFRRLDHGAQVLQNQFWRQNLTLIIGGLVATALGATQAAMGGGVAGLAAAQAVLTGLLVGMAVLIRSRRAQQRYLTARLQAERIKSEFFLFLGRAGDYASGDRAGMLRRQVDAIEDSESVA